MPNSKGTYMEKEAKMSATAYRIWIYKERVKYLAAKRGVTFGEMWLLVLKGEYQKMTADELQELDRIFPIESLNPTP